MGQVYTGAYTEGIEVYFLTLLRLTCGAVQMCLCKKTPSGKVGGGKDAPGDEDAPDDGMCWAMGCTGRCTGRCAGRWDVLGDALASPWRRAAPGRLGDGSRPPLPPGRQPSLRPCSKFALITASSSGKPHLEERLLWGGGGGRFPAFPGGLCCLRPPLPPVAGRPLIPLPSPALLLSPPLILLSFEAGIWEQCLPCSLPPGWSRRQTIGVAGCSVGRGEPAGTGAGRGAQPGSTCPGLGGFGLGKEHAVGMSLVRVPCFLLGDGRS